MSLVDVESASAADEVVQVADINSGPGDGIGNSGYELARLGDKVLFSGNDGTHGAELWIADESGAQLVRDINVGAASSNPVAFTRLEDKIYFVADNGSEGNELWVTDGTEAGTLMVKDIRTGADSSFWWSVGFVEYGGKLWFVANDGLSGDELWSTDGTEAGTSRLLDIRPGSSSAMVTTLTAVKDPTGSSGAGQLYFWAYEDGYGDEPWVSDGTVPGTYRLKDINAGDGGSRIGPHPTWLREGAVLFLAYDGAAHGNELWITDGTTAGTSLVKDIAPAGTNNSPYIATPSMPVIDGFAYFPSTDGVNGTELWKSDGTEAGTSMVSDITPGSEGSSPDSLTVLGSKLIFSAYSSAEGSQIWTSDGTSDGTSLLVDSALGIKSDPEWGDYPYSMDAAAFVVAHGSVFFLAYDVEAGGRLLWQGNASLSSASHVEEAGSLTPFTSSGYVAVETTDDLWFFANDGATGLELWRHPFAPSTSQVSTSMDGGDEPLVGTELTCSSTGWGSGITLSYRWLTSPWGDAQATETEVGTGSTYTPTEQDSGMQIHCEVSAQRTTGQVSIDDAFGAAAVSLPVPVNTSAPVVSGDPSVGSELTCDEGTWLRDLSRTVTWVRDDVDIVQSSDPYTVAAEDVGHELWCRVEATNDVGSSSIDSEHVTVHDMSPYPDTPPSITGDPIVGEILTCDPGTWTNEPSAFMYLWLRDETVIANETDDQYTLTSDDADHSVSCSVTAMNDVGSNVASSEPVGPVEDFTPYPVSGPSIEGDALVGQELTCNPGTWTIEPTSFEYAWFRDGDPIEDEITDLYTVTEDDIGSTLECVVTAYTDVSSGVATSDPTEQVAPLTPQATTPPSITGSPRFGEMLTCELGEWTNNPTEFVVAWYRGQTQVSSGSTRTVKAADVSKALSCQVTATNDLGDGVASSGAVTVAWGTSRVPSLLGRTAAAARSAVLGARFANAPVVTKVAATRRQRRGVVVRQSPAAGSVRARNAKITITVTR